MQYRCNLSTYPFIRFSLNIFSTVEHVIYAVCVCVYFVYNNVLKCAFYQECYNFWHNSLTHTHTLYTGIYDANIMSWQKPLTSQTFSSLFSDGIAWHCSKFFAVVVFFSFRLQLGIPCNFGHCAQLRLCAIEYGQFYVYVYIRDDVIKEGNEPFYPKI